MIMELADRKLLVTSAAIILLATGILSVAGLGGQQEPTEEDNWVSETEGAPMNATFAGGCFWCTEAVFENVDGVQAAVSGYAGGSAETANYKQVSSGETKHKEAVRIRYYPSIISYEELLDLYWRSIDPTDAGGQFVDRGPQYQTVIYAHNQEQYRLAMESKRNLSESGKFEEPIVTEIKNFTTFFRAEDYHQNYSRKSSTRYELYKRGSGRKNVLDRFWEDHPFN